VVHQAGGRCAAGEPLAAWHWAQTWKQEDTQERLAANPSRLAIPALDRYPDADS